MTPPRGSADDISRKGGSQSLNGSAAQPSDGDVATGAVGTKLWDILMGLKGRKGVKPQPLSGAAGGKDGGGMAAMNTMARNVAPPPAAAEAAFGSDTPPQGLQEEGGGSASGSFRHRSDGGGKSGGSGSPSSLLKGSASRKRELALAMVSAGAGASGKDASGGDSASFLSRPRVVRFSSATRNSVEELQR